MQRWTAFLFAALLLGAVAFVVTRGGPKAHGQAHPDGGAGAPADAGAEDATDAGAAEDADAAAEPASDAGGTLLTGEAAPALPADAPKSVVFGVILVVYKGAQGAAPSSRSRDEALALAKTLAGEAKTDFKAAVAKGDKGSMENAGRMPRGMLEPAPEFVLFSLPKGGVSDPVDTPRGFWIAHRIE